jgi:hypothetical protein
MSFQQTKHKGLIFDSAANSLLAGNGVHCYGGIKYFQSCLPTGPNGTYELWDIGQSIGFYSSNDAGTQYTEMAIDSTSLAIIANNATLSNVTVWGSDSILTQGRGDGRYATPANLTAYLPSANFTYANIGGTIPTATNTTLGAIKVGSNLTISNGTLSASIPAAGFTNGDTLNGGSY